MKTIIQTEASECSLACLGMIANHHGQHIELIELRRRFSVSLKGATLSNLINYAEALHFSARALRADLDSIAELRLPCILHWNLNHFVVLERVQKRWNGSMQIVIADPARGKRLLSLEEFSRHFTGVVLELSPTPAFETREPDRRISIRDLTGEISGLRRALVQVISLALALELFTLVQPLFNQFVLDDVIVSGDMDLMKILVLGFGLVLARSEERRVGKECS